MSKTTKELKFDNLYTTFTVLKKVLGAKEATEQFTAVFNNLVEECAKELYDGDINSIVLHKALYNNLVADKRTRLTNPEQYGYVQDISGKIDFVEFINTLLPAEKRTVKKDTVVGVPDKPKRLYNEEDVLAIPDADSLKKFISSIGTAKARAVETTMEDLGLTRDEVVERFDALVALARKQIATLNSVQLSDTLTTKLQPGKKVTLSAKEVEELLKVLGK